MTLAIQDNASHIWPGSWKKLCGEVLESAIVTPVADEEWVQGFVVIR